VTFRVAAERLCESLALSSGERVLTVSAGNRVTGIDDAETLPFRSSAFDVVISPFSTMFLPDHVQTAEEMLRVCRRGGRIGISAWTQGSFNGQLHERIARYMDRGDSSLNPAVWGDRNYLNDLFGHAADALGATDRTHTWRYASPQAWLDEWRSNGGPFAQVFAGVDPVWRAQLAVELLDVVRDFNQADNGSMVVESEYIEFLVHKSSWRQ
jgi:SAM-dependent methyltransferase